MSAHVFDVFCFWKYSLYAILRLPCSRREEVTQKTTDEIRSLLSDAKLDFESVENKALNAYLPRIFNICPFSEEVCTKNQCIDCEVFKNSAKK
jgi:hypothetical protein